MTDKLIQSARRSVLTHRVQMRLATHLKLDHMIRNALQAYIQYYTGDSGYWERRCKPYLDLLPEHYRLTQVTSRPLKHYGQYVRKMSRAYPQQTPSKKRALAFLALVETWYWREYP